jgi:hypothetical protein
LVLFLTVQNQGISVLTNAIKACSEEIEKYKGKLLVKEAARAVSSLLQFLTRVTLRNHRDLMPKNFEVKYLSFCEPNFDKLGGQILHKFLYSQKKGELSSINTCRMGRKFPFQ